MTTKEAFEKLKDEYNSRIFAKYSASNPEILELAKILIDSMDATIESMDNE